MRNNAPPREELGDVPLGKEAHGIWSNLATRGGGGDQVVLGCVASREKRAVLPTEEKQDISLLPGWELDRLRET